LRLEGVTPGMRRSWRRVAGSAVATLIYRSRMHKTLKRNFQVMHGADWMAQRV